MIIAYIGNLSYIKFFKYILKKITLNIIINCSVSSTISGLWRSIITAERIEDNNRSGVWFKFRTRIGVGDR
jgi:hypothetical protein